MRTVLAALFALAAALQVACIDLKAIKVHLATTPSQCSSLCTESQDVLNTCTPTQQLNSCLCTQDIQANIFNCLLCIGKAKNATDYSTAQSDVDQVTSACDAFGSPLPMLTFPGQNPNRVIATTVIGTPPPSSSGTESQNGGAGITSVSPSVTGVPIPSTGASTTSASQTSLSTQTVPSSLTPAATGTPSPTAGKNGNGAYQHKTYCWALVIGALFNLLALA